MRATIAALLLTLGPLVTSAHGQTAPPRFWTAPYGAASLNDWPTPSHGRLGVRVALPFLGRLTFYPGLEIEPELAFSQAFLDLRFQPFAVPGAGSFWYGGGGLAAASNKDRKSTRLNSSHPSISYAVFCLNKETLARTA